MEKVENNKALGEAKISKLLLKFSIPCILSLLVSALYNIVDQIFIGNSELGYLGNAATTVVFPITVIALAFAWCFGDGSAAFLSICQGRKQSNESHKAIGGSFTFTLIISVLFGGISCLHAFKCNELNHQSWWKPCDFNGFYACWCNCKYHSWSYFYFCLQMGYGWCCLGNHYWTDFVFHYFFCILL